MAIVYEGIRCPLCDHAIALDEPFFATSGVFLPPSDSAVAMCDAALHWDCYAKWPERPRFARAYFERRSFASNPYWVVVLSDDEVQAAVGNERIRIQLAATGSLADVTLEEWDAWIARQPEDDPHQIHREALALVVDRLKALGSAGELRARGLSAEQRAELVARGRATPRK